MSKIIIGKHYDNYLVRILNVGETAETPLDDNSYGQIINTDYKKISPIESIGSLWNITPTFDNIILTNRFEVERLFLKASEKFIK